MKRNRKPPFNRQLHSAAFTHARTCLDPFVEKGKERRYGGKNSDRLHSGTYFTCQLHREDGVDFDLTFRLVPSLRIESKFLGLDRSLQPSPRQDLTEQLAYYLRLFRKCPLEFRSRALLTAALSFSPAA